MRLFLVRHADVTVRPEVPSPRWHLSPEGRAATESLAGEPYWGSVRGLHTSPEPKAVGTAQRIAARHGLPIRIEGALREVEGRPWSGHEAYNEQARRYLAGESVDRWERRETALTRVRACFDDLTSRHPELDVGIVSHGLVLTLYLTGLLDLDANASYELWARMLFPDVAIVDTAAGRLEREFGRRTPAG